MCSMHSAAASFRPRSTASRSACALDPCAAQPRGASADQPQHLARFAAAMRRSCSRARRDAGAGRARPGCDLRWAEAPPRCRRRRRARRDARCSLGRLARDGDRAGTTREGLTRRRVEAALDDAGAGPAAIAGARTALVYVTAALRPSNRRFIEGRAAASLRGDGSGHVPRGGHRARRCAAPTHPPRRSAPTLRAITMPRSSSSPARATARWSWPWRSSTNARTSRARRSIDAIPWSKPQPASGSSPARASCISSRPTAHGPMPPSARDSARPSPSSPSPRWISASSRREATGAGRPLRSIHPAGMDRSNESLEEAVD